MNRDDAEEFTQTLEQINAATWRQIDWADRQGIPTALGLNLKEWVSRIGGYVRLSIPDRQQAVAELVAEGRTQREIVDVLGVGKGTIDRDLKVAPDGAEPFGEQGKQSDPAPSGAVEWEQPSLDDAAALLEQAAEVADLVNAVKTERRPKPEPGPPAHPAASFLWARLSEVRALNASDASPEQRPDVAEAIEMWSKEIDRLQQEVAPS